MSDLIAFLRARLDVAERVARAATPGPLTIDDQDYPEAIYADGGTVVSGGRWGGEASIFDREEDALHIARWDPPRVLAEVQAKRAILDDYEALGGAGDPFAFAGRREGLVALEQVIRHISAVFQDHPDYRQEWRP